MRAKRVLESINFERGKDPKDSMHIGKPYVREKDFREFFENFDKRFPNQSIYDSNTMMELFSKEAWNGWLDKKASKEGEKIYHYPVEPFTLHIRHLLKWFKEEAPKFEFVKFRTPNMSNDRDWEILFKYKLD